ncbi:MAG TPA: serine/threonine protein kinase [Mesorhizobium sp.]|jgi:hypothetical protein|nr:serine/threonine protein kinase [Mesorhizobium sp.]
MEAFVTNAVLKRDVFSETQKGHLMGDPGTTVIRRIVSVSPIWSRPLAWWLAGREIRALKALAGVPGTPRLIETDRHGLLRTWTEGMPIHLARPRDPEWYRDAHRVLRALRRRGITHNDLAKPQNWLEAPNGSAAVIDFQLASVHRRPGRMFQVMAYEDFRHLLKQKRAFAPHLMTPTGRRLLKRRSLPSRIWRASGKRLYNLVTRRILDWSDGEGTGDRIEREETRMRATLAGRPGGGELVLVPFPLPAKGSGIYAFVEGPPGPLPRLPGADLVQLVGRLPRGEDGKVRDDLLALVATNRIEEAEARMAGDPTLRDVMAPILAGRLNLSDRRLSAVPTP